MIFISLLGCFNSLFLIQEIPALVKCFGETGRIE